MSIGEAYLSKIVEMQDVFAFGVSDISKEDFVGSEAEVYSFITRHIHQHGKVPVKEVIFVETGVNLPQVPDEPLSYWKESLQTRTLDRKIRETITDLSDQLKGGKVREAIDVLQKANMEIFKGKFIRKLELLTDLYDEVIADHDYRQLYGDPDIVDIPFGFPYLDKISDGLQKGDTVALVGPTSVGKSYVLLRMALAAHEAGKSPLIITMEMTGKQVARRLLALQTKIEEDVFRRGLLSSFTSRKTAVSVMTQLRDQHPFYIADGRLVLKMDDIMTLCQAVRPDVLYLDAAYLIKMAKTTGKWESIAEIAEQVKIMAGVLDIPIVGTYQMNKDKTVYGSRAVSHLASIVLLLMESKLEEESIPLVGSWACNEFRTLVIAKGRSGERGMIKLVYSMEHICEIEQIEVLQSHLRNRGD